MIYHIFCERSDSSYKEVLIIREYFFSRFVAICSLRRMKEISKHDRFSLSFFFEEREESNKSCFLLTKEQLKSVKEGDVGPIRVNSLYTFSVMREGLILQLCWILRWDFSGKRLW